MQAIRIRISHDLANNRKKLPVSIPLQFRDGFINALWFSNEGATVGSNLARQRGHIGSARVTLLGTGNNTLVEGVELFPGLGCEVVKDFWHPMLEGMLPASCKMARDRLEEFRVEVVRSGCTIVMAVTSACGPVGGPVHPTQGPGSTPAGSRAYCGDDRNRD